MGTEASLALGIEKVKNKDLLDHLSTCNIQDYQTCSKAGLCSIIVSITSKSWG